MYIYLVGGIPTPLKNMTSSLGIIIPYPIWWESHSKFHGNQSPPTSYVPYISGIFMDPRDSYGCFLLWTPKASALEAPSDGRSARPGSNCSRAIALRRLEMAWVAVPGLVNSQFAIEAMAIEIVDLPIDSMVIFHSKLWVYQRLHFRVLNQE